ncbi:MAG TPA: CIA30 family protein [Oscillatoriales cyanobacterium M4454_W2019_049]|nr:MAG: NAD-dependent epimerase/dehydratase family protein [Cyanobacteria bacterium J055]HIK31587.1 CIA30 family protein [Oscillatoriales cyanobacterium M4454_W2019_049]
MTQSNRVRWDLGRFWQTLQFFDVIPFVSPLKGFQKLLGVRSMNQPPAKAPASGVVLVAGATGGVGKRVVRQLQQRGYAVRALVRDAKRGRETLGNDVELVEADLTLPETLNTEVFKDIRAVICCTGTRVQPIEGDTPNREKYYQGIKFYLPEVVETPEYIEYRGVQNLVKAATPYLKRARNQRSIFDFTQPSEEIARIWGVVDDVVMGGVSESSIRLMSDAALFSGNVSTANSGGFASVRTRNFEVPLDLSAYEGIELRVKGDGKRYKFIIRSEEKWDGVGYCYSFKTVYNTWTTVRIPFADLIPVFRAKTLKDYPPFDSSRVTSLQLMLSKFEYDGELNPDFSPGFFQLQIESIQTYSDRLLPQFVMVSSAGVTRPGKPGLNLEEEPPAVRLNDQLGGILTWKLRGEESVRDSGIPYAIVRPCALTEEPGGKVLIADRGDTIKGKCSRDDIAELCVRAIENPQVVNATFEVKEAETQDRDSQNWDGFFASLQ